MPAKKNEVQKNNILIAARKLFYEKGYKDTYFDDIASACGISKTLVAYYFNSKAELAHEVFATYSDELKNKGDYKVFKYYYDRNVHEYNLQISTAIGIRFLYQMYLDDPKVTRFNDERADDKYGSFWPGNTTKFISHKKKYNLNINNDNDELSMISWAAPASCFAVAYAFKQGDIIATEEEVLDYIVGLNFRLMNVSSERVKEIIEESHIVLKKVPMKIKPYFTIE